MESGLNAQIILEKKNKIVELLKAKGPSLPSAISKEIGISLLFTSALLSEMINDKLVKCSYLKIGGSPLYYLEGQEAMLDNFVNHLQAKEKEAFQLLKDAEVLDEEFLHPAHRVALRSIKDFAFPFKVNVEGREKIFWRYHLLNQEDAIKKVEELFLKNSKKEIKEETKETKKEIKETEKKEAKKEKKVEAIDAKNKGAKKEEIQIKKEESKEKRKSSYLIKKGKAEFYNKIYEHLREQGLEILEEINQNDVVCMALANFAFGKVKFLVVANSKKKINEADLSLAYQQGIIRKTPVLFLTTGDLTKKANAYVEMLGNYIFVKKI